jgi:hypothetical protein
MANHCYNHISIQGNEEEIKNFAELLEVEKGKNSGCDIYENLRATFGKFEPDARWFDIDTQISESEIILSGDSAWCPALELLTEISKKYQSFIIRYEYNEQGCDFSGWADIEKGTLTDNCFSYWKGLFEMHGEDEVLQQILEGELGCYEDETELKEADFFTLFSEENQNQILETFLSKTI